MQKSKVFKSVRYLTLAAMLTAISVVIGIICKNFLNFSGGLFRITFENLPIIICGIVSGPVIGGIVGLLSDLISYLLSPQTYPPNLVVTFGAMCIGVISGIFSRFVIKRHGYLQITLSVGVSHVIGSMVIKSIGLYAFYGWAVLFRIPTYLLIASAEAALICLMYKNANIRKLFGWT